MFNLLKKSVYISFITNIILYSFFLLGQMEKINYLLNFFLLGLLMFFIEISLGKLKKICKKYKN